MINRDGKVIYVGKAKHLKNRLLSYTQVSKLSNRIKMMVSNIERVEFTIVNSEIEALLLENNLIKELKPFYNVLLKDDKTFPYIVIDDKHEFPRISKFRTKHPKLKNFFGPYPSSIAINDTLKIIQKTLLIRTCTDSYFSNRERPCLQYFIKRCSAPCIGKISIDDYNKNICLAKDLLNGRDETVREILIQEMKIFAKKQDFENAAIVRDRIKALSEIQSKQFIQIESTNSIDFISISFAARKASVGVTFFRAGKNVGTETFLIEDIIENDPKQILISFIVQYYDAVSKPSEIITNIDISEEMKKILENIRVSVGVRGTFKQILATTEMNASLKLRQITDKKFDHELLELKKMLGLSKIERIETYDNSHIQGTNACGVMVVFEDGAIQKSMARKFNISERDARGGDDISMMKFSLEKRFGSKSIQGHPDLIIIDGGKTQVSIAKDILREFELSEKVKVIGIAKQNNRRVGDEKIVFDNYEEIVLGKDSALLNFLILLRNEAHKSAISFHRKKRKASLIKSKLDEIPNIGSVRKKALLEHFGSIDAIRNASIPDLKMVKGIDEKTATLICDFFRKV